MAQKTRCQTPGTMFSTRINSNSVRVGLELPFELNLTEAQAELLEANIHNAMELVLAPFFVSH